MKHAGIVWHDLEPVTPFRDASRLELSRPPWHRKISSIDDECDKEALGPTKSSMGRLVWK